MLMEKTMVSEGALNRQVFIYLLIYSNKLAYLQLITDLVYRSSPPKSHEQGYLNLSKNLEKYVYVFCEFVVIWPVFGIVPVFGESLSQFLSSVANINVTIYFTTAISSFYLLNFLSVVYILEGIITTY